LPKKIAIIGPESTGKSTLSQALAAALRAPWVPEYARAYLEQLGRPYTEDDLLQMAYGQLQAEDAAAREAGSYLICDTDLYVIKVWSEHKYGHCHSGILKEIARRSYDAYILTYIDTRWQYDPLREHPDDAMRSYFYHVYHDIVVNSGLPFIVVKGSPEERLQQALHAVKNW
jgi:NadR type nicotinamide-nucleotide adenylyltransferase